MSIDPIALEDAAYWLLCERSAQMGESYTREMHEAAKAEDQDYISDIRFQVKSAIKAYESAKTEQPDQTFEQWWQTSDVIPLPNLPSTTKKDWAKSGWDAAMTTKRESAPPHEELSFEQLTRVYHNIESNFRKFEKMLVEYMNKPKRESSERELIKRIAHIIKTDNGWDTTVERIEELLKTNEIEGQS
jgi:hypothetical protein